MSESLLDPWEWDWQGHTKPDRLVEEATYTIIDGKVVVTLPFLDAISTIRESEPITLDFKSMKPINIPAAVQDVPNHSSASDPPTNSVLERDDTYYLPMISFEVEDTHFMVPRWRFPESTTHFDLILPQDPHEDCVITLGSISAKDFRGMMKFMYPVKSINCNLELMKEDLVSILKVSTEWKMLNHRKRAIKALGLSGVSSPPSHGPVTLSPEEDILLGKSCGIPSWYRRGCVAVVANVDLEVQHQNTLGIGTMIKLMQARDRVYINDMRSYNSRFSFRSRPYHNIILNLFEDDSSETLANLPIIDRIIVARNYGLSDWLLSCYHQLVEREESFSLKEVEVLGVETTLKLWKARHELFRTYRAILEQFDPPRILSDAELVEIAVDEVFKGEFDGAKRLSRVFEKEFREDFKEAGKQPSWPGETPNEIPISFIPSGTPARGSFRGRGLFRRSLQGAFRGGAGGLPGRNQGV